MLGIIDWAAKRARMVLAFIVLTLAAGALAYTGLPKEGEPDIEVPALFISVPFNGISASDAETLLVRPMEQELSRIEGVKELKSTAYQGGGYVLLEFQAGFDKDKALDDVQKGVDKAKPELPLDAEEPEVTEVNFSLFPLLLVTLSGDIPERTLLKLARNLQDKIETIPSVLEAGIAGNREELVEIIVDPELIESYGLDGVAIIDFFEPSE